MPHLPHFYQRKGFRKTQVGTEKGIGFQCRDGEGYGMKVLLRLAFKESQLPLFAIEEKNPKAKEG